MKKLLLGIAICLFFSVLTNAQIYMYGTTSEGGANGLGTIYRVNKNGQNFQKLYDFSNSTGGAPYGGMTLANNGKLYGFTTQGGQIVNSGASVALGTFFQFDPLTNAYTVIEYIDDESTIGNTFNNSPTLSPNGLLYIASQGYGLSSFDGILSSFDPTTGTFSVLDTFTHSYGTPRSKLLLASDGNLYVTTFNGGTNGFGTITKYDVAQDQLFVLYNSSGPNGSEEFADAENNPLFEASNGVLYGSSRKGGLTSSTGCVFKINKDGSGFQNLYNFSSGIQDEGWYPEGGFIEKNGLLYGSTTQEDVQDVNSGTIYTIDISNNTLNFIYTLDLEGAQPQGTFVESSNGRLYVTCNGGPINTGSLIELNPLNTSVTERHTFGTANGTKPKHNELAIVDFSSLSIDKSSLLNNSIKIYPNPMKDVINITVEDSNQIETIKILDLKGAELFIDNSKENKNVINTSFLSSGIYLLSVQTNFGNITRKIVKE
ncbi:choice-of-anchor tandem repeat GloVer-containing protein [Aestuariivivens sp. NBU2969]|uniref:choice-of-anchor tandem repeat GloVer-containing protein n=1 Tax=Aestuariivivens sp. NBU2969 TaxID=2873267 RepID=UPI001CBE92F3|nr:choice-of-anchor tandem repeat GloVer-containing protein [Aestuariivivens sp. NBU2969]